MILDSNMLYLAYKSKLLSFVLISLNIFSKSLVFWNIFVIVLPLKSFISNCLKNDSLVITLNDFS